MNSIRKHKKRLLVLILVIIVIGAWLFIRGNADKKNIIREWEGSYKIEDVLALELGISHAGDVLLVVDENDDSLMYNTIIPNRYIALKHMNGTFKTLFGPGSYEMTKYEQFEYKIYDIETRELKKTIDLKEIAESIPGYEARGLGIVRNKGQDIIRIEFRKTPKSEEEDEKFRDSGYDKKVKYYNIDTGKVYENMEEATPSPESIAQEKSLSILNKWKGYAFSIENGFLQGWMTDKKYTGFLTRQYEDFDGYTQILISANNLPQNNEALYTNFPILREYQGKYGYRIAIYLEGYPSAEEIMRMFLEDGQEISFEGAVLKGEQSIDGQDHEIHSFEEFYQWYKP